MIRAIDEIDDFQARFVKMSTSSVGRRCGRKPSKSVVYYKCSVCEYVSERYYNVTRHEFRIHTSSAKKRQCCGKHFETKGDYYLHCEECHPLSRATSIISRTKYKILPAIGIVKPRKSSMPSRNENATPYMLRNRRRNARAPKRWGIDDSELTTDFESSSEEESADESSVSSRESSGYETKNTSLDINQNELDPRNSLCEPLNDSSGSCADDISSLEQPTDPTLETDSPTSDPGACETSMSSDNAETDESIENFTSGFAPSANPFDLPIKKRILRDMTNRGSPSHVTSAISYPDRLHRRVPNDSGGRHSPEAQRKPRNMAKRAKNSRDATNNEENVAPNLTSITDQQKSPNEEKVQVQVDPRISWHDITRIHREYFDSLLRNQSLLDRFRQPE